MYKLTFLIVDDIAVNRILLSDMVRLLDHNYVLAENGEVALQLLAKEKIDIILMDIEMPKMNGFETITYIRTQTKPPLQNIPIIAITAYQIDEEKFLEYKFDHYLNKPFHFAKLKAIIEPYFQSKNSFSRL